LSIVVSPCAANLLRFFWMIGEIVFLSFDPLCAALLAFFFWSKSRYRRVTIQTNFVVFCIDSKVIAREFLFAPSTLCKSWTTWKNSRRSFDSSFDCDVKQLLHIRNTMGQLTCRDTRIGLGKDVAAETTQRHAWQAIKQDLPASIKHLAR